PGPWKKFLSCLCGSERADGQAALFGNFLSCLCGSERADGQAALFGNFLSCLCGSELEPVMQKTQKIKELHTSRGKRALKEQQANPLKKQLVFQRVQKRVKTTESSWLH
ncbi:MAG: hypothetical protein SPF94_10015, partial [Desulfovibrio sp.]|nr:hypothetical protein [Desulfovibrio sp.]